MATSTYAIIEDSGSQIKVSEGDTILVDPRELPEDGSTLTFDRVLMIGTGEGGAKIGAPVLEGATVTADILDEGKLPKVEIIKQRRRKNYRRRNGHRQPFLRVKVTGIAG